MKPSIKIKKILCPVDFSAYSKHAVEYAIAFAKQYDAEIKLIHAVESPSTAFGYADLEIPEPELVDEFREQAEKQLIELTEALQERQTRVSQLLVFGKPFTEIIEEAANWPADMIILGTHGRSGLEHLLIGSVAEKIVRKANCPVLTVRHPEHEFVHP
ncbi:MAG: universal stress protein [Lentisphaeria bacterium]